jgi:hypothetical protein
LRRLFTEYVEMARLTRTPTFHSCRHTFIGWCANELHIPLPVVQRLAGHQTISTTMGYVHTSERTVLEAMERSLLVSGLGTDEEREHAREHQASSGASAVAAWMASAEAYDRYLEERGAQAATGRLNGARGEHMGNAPPRAARAGRSGAAVEEA